MLFFSFRNVGDALLHLDAALGQRTGLDREQTDLERRSLRMHRGDLEPATLAPVASMPFKTDRRLTVMAVHSLADAGSSPCWPGILCRNER